MKKNEDLKSLIEQLKTETDIYEMPEESASFSGLQQDLPVKPSFPARQKPESFKHFEQPRQESHFFSPSKSLSSRQVLEQPINSKFNVIWSENKETLLFGLLSSAIVMLIGVFSSKEYIIMAGAIAFLLFTLLSFFAFFRYIFIASENEAKSQDLKRKIADLEAKIDGISFSKGQTASEDKIYEMDAKLEELKTVIKTLSRGSGKNI